MAYKFNAVNSIAGSAYNCCYKCEERFAGDETRPNCHTTCERYLTAREKELKEQAERREKKRKESQATSATIEGLQRMKTRKRAVKSTKTSKR